MAKNKFNNVINDILGDDKEVLQSVDTPSPTVTTPRGKGRPKNEDSERKTFIIRTELVNKLKIIAAKEGILQKDILELALGEIVERYEKKHGEITTKPIQKSNIADIF